MGIYCRQMTKRIFSLKLTRTQLILGCIFFLATFLRLYQLSTIPVGVHGDEASIGYNAYSLLKIGRDQNGIKFPLVIDQWGDFRPAGYHYLTIPFVATFGLSPFAVRLPAAIFGSATVLVVYALLLELFSSIPIAMVGSLLLAISPWHIIISRATSEGVVALFFVILGMWALLAGTKKGSFNKKHIGVALGSLVVSLLFYHSSRIFVPMMVPVFIVVVIATQRLLKKAKVVLFGGWLLIVAIVAALLTYTKGTVRPLDISIFNLPGGAGEVRQQIAQDGDQPILLSRFFHNKLRHYGRVFLHNYFQHLSGEFLFVTNGSPIRYSVPWSGNLYLVELPFLLFGSSLLLVEAIRRKRLLYLVPLAWVLVGAVPAGLTVDDIPNIQRASLMIPGLVAISAFGFYQTLALFRMERRGFVAVGVGVMLGASALTFFHNYFHHLKTDEPWHRSAAVPDLLFTLSDLSKSYKKVIMTSQGNNNFIHFLFYTKVDPAYFYSLGSPREHEGLTFGKYEYVGNKCPLGGDSEGRVTEPSHVLFVNHFDCKVPVNAETLKIIRHPDGTGAYRILRIPTASLTQ